MPSSQINRNKFSFFFPLLPFARPSAKERPPQRRLAGKNQIAQICCTTHALFGKVWVLILREKREPRRLWRLLLWQGNNWRRERPNFNPLPPPSSSSAGKVAKETPSLPPTLRPLPSSLLLFSFLRKWKMAGKKATLAICPSFFLFLLLLLPIPSLSCRMWWHRKQVRGGERWYSD